MTICSPQIGSTVANPVVVKAAITDARSVTVKIYVDGASQFQTNSKQIDWSTTLSPGSHRVTVKGWDSSFPDAFSSSTTFTVSSST